MIFFSTIGKDNENLFSREVGLQTTPDGRVLRKAKIGNRRWTLSDLCRIANYFKETPSGILKKVEGQIRNRRI